MTEVTCPGLHSYWMVEPGFEPTSANPKASVAVSERSMWHSLGSHVVHSGLFLCLFITNNKKNPNKTAITDIYGVSVTESQAFTRVTSFDPLNRPHRAGPFSSLLQRKLRQRDIVDICFPCLPSILHPFLWKEHLNFPLGNLPTLSVGHLVKTPLTEGRAQDAGWDALSWNFDS